MRIIAGKHRGRVLTAVGKGDIGARLRPTADRVRESLFNLLAGGRFGDPITGARVLDLFAGTGGLGLEALSRGAGHVSFVDDGVTAQRLIAANIALLDAAGQTRLIRRDARRLPANDAAPFTLVFLDPPYGRSLGEAALTQALSGGWVAEDALIVWEEGARITPPPGMHLLEARRYGDTTVNLLSRSER